MWWLEPSEPLATWSTPAPMPRGQVRVTPLAFTGSGELSVAHSRTTGGWAVLTSAERDAIHRLDGSRSDDDRLAELAYARGLVSIDGKVRFTPADHAAAADAARDHYGLILILGAGCNITCSYCYLGHEVPRASTRMDEARARAEIDAALARPEQKVIVDLGELAVGGPLVPVLLAHATATAQAAGKDLVLTVQTNATTIDDRTAALLASFDVQTGVSLDGTAEQHDAARRHRNGAGTHRQAVDGLRRLRDAGVRVHLVATVGRHNVGDPEGVLRALWEHDPASYLLKPVLAEGEAAAAWDDVGVSAPEYTTFVSGALDLVGRTHLDRADQTVQKFLFRMIGDRRGWRDGCTSRTCAAGESLHVVDAKGDVHACPRFVSSRQGHLVPVRIGPTRSAVPAGGLVAPALRRAPTTCEGCEWLASCGGGCTLAGQNGRTDVPLPDPHCSAHDAIHRWLADQLPAMLVGRHRHAAALGGAVVRGEEMAWAR